MAKELKNLIKKKIIKKIKLMNFYNKKPKNENNNICVCVRE